MKDKTALRDHFASIAIQSLLGNPDSEGSYVLKRQGAKGFANYVYRIADAMVEEKARFEMGIKNVWES